MSFIKEAGTDISIFKTHSVRGAATTEAANALLPKQETRTCPTGQMRQLFANFIKNQSFPPTLKEQFFFSLHC